tara:strand:+ start:211 stop:537 length:327 start_codon:yes stop_codon:yes gene_type:complete
MKNIAELLVQEYNNRLKTLAFLTFYKDWDGDMAMREKNCNCFLTILSTVEETAILVVGGEMWDDFKKQRMGITETHWYANRRFHVDGQPLSDWWLNKIKQENEQDAAA